MQRATLNLFLDAVLLAVFCVLIWLEVAIDMIFPPPSQANGWLLWGWSLDRWSAMRMWTMLTFGVLVVLHVMLHWSWVCGILSKKLSKLRGSKFTLNESAETLVGVAFLVAILHVLALAYLAAYLSVRESKSGRNGTAFRSQPIRAEQCVGMQTPSEPLPDKREGAVATIDDRLHVGRDGRYGEI